MFLPLGGSLFFFRYSLSSADQVDEGKDISECQIHAKQTPLKWLPFLIHEKRVLYKV